MIPKYLNQYPECEHLTQPLEWEKDKQTVDVVGDKQWPFLIFHSLVFFFQVILCFKCLEQVLLFTAAPPTSATPAAVKHYCTSGHRLVQRLLSGHMRCVYHALLSTQPMRVVLSCFRLLAAMVLQGSASARMVLQGFNCSYKPLETFFGKTLPISDPQTVRVFSNGVFTF